MDNLLKKQGYSALCSGIYLSDYYNAKKVLAPLLDDEKGESVQYVTAMAYLIGIKQGVHDERAKRRKGDLQ